MARKVACPKCESTDVSAYFDDTSQRKVHHCNDCGYED